MSFVIVGGICLVAGFVGGILVWHKESAKLTAIEQEITNAEVHATADVRGLIASIRKHL